MMKGHLFACYDWKERQTGLYQDVSSSFLDLKQFYSIVVKRKWFATFPTKAVNLSLSSDHSSTSKQWFRVRIKRMVCLVGSWTWLTDTFAQERVCLQVFNVTSNKTSLLWSWLALQDNRGLKWHIHEKARTIFNIFHFDMTQCTGI